ncbi:hypothetical protein FRC12_001328 [Ceratobasidium sp. 428]|nr:hypothetical protein FRC12_001328 [Ceratobasidium sp. 428]
MAPSTDIAAFRSALQRSKRIILVAGAGLSSASGILTFRGAGGYWRSFEATRLATPEAFRANPSLVWQFYHYRREKVFACKPNNAHHVIARFLRHEYRRPIAPLADRCTLITQNVDGLSIRAREELAVVNPPDDNSTSNQELGSIIEMHGRLVDTICTRCKDRRSDTRSPICPALDGTEARTDAIMDEGGKRVPEATIPTEDLPHCEKEGCGGLLRPGVVWFGEAIPDLDTIDKEVEAADMCLVVGTSSVVYPAAGFAGIVQENGGMVAVFNIDSSQGDSDADFLFIGPCEETLGDALGISLEGSL